jgi:hypothetical protein
MTLHIYSEVCALIRRTQKLVRNDTKRKYIVTLNCLFILQRFPCAHIVTTWSRVLPENRMGPHLVKKFNALYANRKCITTFTTARHLSLSKTRSVQSMPPSHLMIRFNIILHSTPILVCSKLVHTIRVTVSEKGNL